MWAIVFCSSMFVLWKRSTRAPFRIRSPYVLLLIGLFALSVVHLLLLHSPILFFGNAFRLQGVLSLWILLLFACVGSQVGRHIHLSWMAVISLFFTCLAALILPKDFAMRAVGTLGEANSLSAYVLFLLPLAITGIHTKSTRHGVIALSFVLALLCIYLSGSRSSLVGLCAEIIFFVLAKKIHMRIAVICTALFLAVSLVLPFFDSKQVFDSRVVIWRTAIEAGRQRPLLGWGIGNVEIGLRHGADTLQTSLRFQYVDSSHNVFLDWWVQGGVVGLALFSSILVVTFLSLIHHRDKALIASLFGIFAVMLFNPVSTAILLPLWWIIGQAMVPHSASVVRKRSHKKRRK